jgi:hypothetical protein
LNGFMDTVSTIDRLYRRDVSRRLAEARRKEMPDSFEHRGIYAIVITAGRLKRSLGKKR